MSTGPCNVFTRSARRAETGQPGSRQREAGSKQTRGGRGGGGG